jgi:hypothetical protein
MAFGLSAGAALALGVVGGGVLASQMGGGEPANQAQNVNYAAAAQAQGQANIAAAQATTQLGRPNQITPWGSQTWYQGQPPGSPGSSATPPTSSWQQGQQPNATPYGGGRATAGQGMGAGGYGGYGGYGAGATGSAGQPSANNLSQYQASGYGSGYSPANQWTSVTQLSPVQQQLFDTQNQISQNLGNTGLSGLGRVSQAMNTPFSMAGMPNVQYGPQNPNLQTSVENPNLQSKIDTTGVNKVPGSEDFGALQQKATDAAMARQNIQLDQQQQSLQAQLANQGITPGSEAYNRAMQPLEQSRVDAQNQAFLTGTQYQNQLFGQAATSNQLGFGEAQAQGQFGNTAAGQQFSQNLGAGQFGNQALGQQYQQGLQGQQFSNQALQQGIGQQAYLRELPLNELNALRSGAQVQAPTFQNYSGATVAPAPVFGAAQAQGQQNQANYATQVGAYNNQMSGLFGLGGAGMMAYAMSDRRLKRNIKRLGTTASGLPWYRFDYIWGEPGVGVMADEVPARMVRMHSSGYAMVDYSQVL